MTRSIFKPIVFGVLFGAAAFFVPFFLLKGIFFFMLIGFIFRMIWWRGYRWGNHYRYQMVMADKIRSMSEEEYNAFKNKFQDCNTHYNGHGCYGRGYYGRGCHSDHKDCNDTCDTKTETKSDTETK